MASAAEKEGAPGGTGLAMAEGELALGTFSDVLYAPKDNQTGRNGTLHVSSKRLRFVLSGTSAPALEVPFRRVTLHAITKDETVQQRPCLYCQFEDGREAEVDARADADADAPAATDSAHERTVLEWTAETAGREDAGLAGGEAFFAPGAQEALQAMFDAFSRAVEMNPGDPDEALELMSGLAMLMGGGAEGIVAAEDDLTEEGAEQLSRLEGLLTVTSAPGAAPEDEDGDGDGDGDGAEGPSGTGPASG